MTDKISVLASRISSLYRRPGEIKICACVGTPPCFDLKCGHVWKWILENPNEIASALDWQGETREHLSSNRYYEYKVNL